MYYVSVFDDMLPSNHLIAPLLFSFFLFCFVLSFLTGNEILRGGNEFGFSLFATDQLAPDGPCMLLSIDVN